MTDPKGWDYVENVRLTKCCAKHIAYMHNSAQDCTSAQCKKTEYLPCDRTVCTGCLKEVCVRCCERTAKVEYVPEEQYYYCGQCQTEYALVGPIDEFVP